MRFYKYSAPDGARIQRLWNFLGAWWNAAAFDLRGILPAGQDGGFAIRRALQGDAKSAVLGSRGSTAGKDARRYGAGKSGAEAAAVQTLRECGGVWRAWRREEDFQYFRPFVEWPVLSAIILTSG